METALSVPANLLLMGEYAVLEPGGLGITIAPDVRCRVTITDAPFLEIEGLMKNERTVWKEGDAAAAGLLDPLVAAAKDYIPQKADSPHLKGKITVDSSSFYYEDGRKTGFGSSAAVAVGVTASLLSLAGFSRNEVSQSCTVPALDGHSRFQGKKGSGYDILTSFQGGIGLFSGGPLPRLEPLHLPWFPPLRLYRGEEKVASPRAIGKYQDWKVRRPRAMQQFVQDSNDCVRGFARARSWEEARACVEASRSIGLELGEAIGVSAEMRVPRMEGPEVFKALGAGNELGILFNALREVPNSIQLVLSEKGLLWHS
jgi:phosphomevalonate kinase